MKNNNQPSLYFSPHPLKAQKQEPPAKNSIQSPYLRAVLSGKTRTSSHAKTTDSNLSAALRYIVNSR
ncbi:MAG: hypothetical protein WBB06_09500 [Chitinophagaceae bacterium]